MASHSSCFVSAHFPLWQGVISQPLCSLGGMMRNKHLEQRALSGASSRCCRGGLSFLASCGELPCNLRQFGVQRGAQLPPSLLALGFHGVPSPEPATASWGQATQGEGSLCCMLPFRCRGACSCRAGDDTALAGRATAHEEKGSLKSCL